jgi:hypothetical protein
MDRIKKLMSSAISSRMLRDRLLRTEYNMLAQIGFNTYHCAIAFFFSKLVFKLSNTINPLDTFEEEVATRDILNATMLGNGVV